jgi:hypothetical protein
MRTMAPGLRYEGHDLHPLPGRGAFDWVDVKRFAVEPAGLAGADALTLLLDHPRFPDTYATAGSPDEDAGPRHGPCWLGSLAPAAYEPVDRETALRTVSAFTHRHDGDDETRGKGGDANGDGEPAARAAVVRAHVVPVVEAATERHRLRDLGPDALHDFG